MINIETINEYKLYLKQLCKNRIGEKELIELMLKVFQDGIKFNQGVLKIEIKDEK